MGGAPYTSRGCMNCRKRKIKCDLEKPECRRCEKSGLRCLGYDKGRNFLPHTLKAKRTPDGEVIRPVRHNVTHLKPLSLSSFSTMTASAEIRTQLFSNFMGDFFVPNAKAKDDSMYFLMAQFPIRAGQSELIDRSVMALVAAFLGRAKKDQAMIVQGMQIYNTALNVLRCTLQRSRAKDQQEGANLLSSTLILHTYESMHSNGDALKGFQAHVKGAVAIMKQYDLAGRDADTLTKAIHMRQKWAAAFFVLNSTYGSEIELECLLLRQDDSIQDSLMGILAECALLQRLLEEITFLQGPAQEKSYKNLVRRCAHLQARLHGEFLDESDHIKELDGMPVTCTRNELGSEPRLQWLDYDLLPYKFNDTKTAQIYILFWVAMLVTGRISYRAQLAISGESAPTCALFYANEICRSVAYWLQPGRSISFCGPINFGVSQASKCFIQLGMEKEFLWCQGVYSFVKQSGYDIISAVSEQEIALWNRTWGEGSGSQVMDAEKSDAKLENIPTSSSPSLALPVRNPCK